MDATIPTLSHGLAGGCKDNAAPQSPAKCAFPDTAGGAGGFFSVALRILIRVDWRDSVVCRMIGDVTPSRECVKSHILGRPLEQSLRWALAISQGSFAVFVTLPISLALLLANAASLVASRLTRLRRLRRA